MTVCSMTRSKVEVTSPLQLEIQPSNSSAIYNGSWQLTTDSNCGTIYKFDRAGFFDICPSLCVTQGWLNSSEADGLAVGR